MFFANVSDWYTSFNRTGWAATTIYDSRIKLQLIGDSVRSFKPQSILPIHVRSLAKSLQLTSRIKPSRFKNHDMLIRIHRSFTNLLQGRIKDKGNHEDEVQKTQVVVMMSNLQRVIIKTD